MKPFAIQPQGKLTIVPSSVYDFVDCLGWHYVTVVDDTKHFFVGSIPPGGTAETVSKWTPTFPMW